MSLSPAKKAYRQTEAEKEKMRIYAREYRRQQPAKERDAIRQKANRDAPGGAEINRQRVKDNRSALGRGYLADLISEQTGATRRCIPQELVALKREQIVLHRLAKEMQTLVNTTKELRNEAND